MQQEEIEDEEREREREKERERETKNWKQMAGRNSLHKSWDGGYRGFICVVLIISFPQESRQVIRIGINCCIIK